jgi:transcriptional repressor NrdR
VVDSRQSAEGVRRRRQCAQCGHRFTTQERVERRLPDVVKRDGRREPFLRSKVTEGILLACRKRPVPRAEVDRAVDRVETLLEASRSSEVSSRQVGEVVLGVLREVDAVAYVRFSSVYLAFESPAQFVDMIRAEDPP